MKRMYIIIAMTKHVLVLCAILCAALLSYGNGVHNGFVLDDRVLLPSHAADPRAFSRYFDPRAENFCYRPLLHVVLAAEIAVFRGNPAGYHIFNVFLLGSAAFLFYLILLNLFGNFRLAFAAAFLFFLHPLNTMLVNYISTVNMLVLAVCALGSILIILNRGGKIWSGALFLLSLLCHEAALLLPLYTTAVMAIKEKNLGKEVIKCAKILWVMAAFYFVWRLNNASLGSNIFNHFTEFQMGFGQYLTGVVLLVFWYVKQLFVPSGIVFTWGVPVEGLSAWTGSAFLTVMAAIAFFVFRWWKTQRVLALGLVWFVLGFGLIAAGSLAKPKWFLIIEPYWLLFSLMGFVLVLAWVGVSHARAWILIAALAIFWIWTNRIYNQIWSDERKYCYFWLGEFPQYRAIHVYLADNYDRERNFALASYHNRQSLTSHPLDQLRYYSSQGLVAIKAGDWTEAKKFLSRAYAINPRSAMVLGNLGVVALSEGNKAMAKELFKRALQESPEENIWRMNLRAVENMK